MSGPLRSRAARQAARSAAQGVNHPFGCGVDVVELDRFKRAMKRWGPTFTRRVFTPIEMAYARRHADAVTHLAARFAAKEAVFKAMSQVDPAHPLTMGQIEIRNDQWGRPSVVLRGSRRRRHAVYISLSHARRVVVACAIAYS